jgi:choline dehydrogenase-like flavoprotein
MAHNGGVILSVSPTRNSMIFQKTLGVTDFYWGEEGFDYPMGFVQSLGHFKAETMRAHGPPAPWLMYRTVAKYAIPWRIIHEDLPSPQNRVSLKGDQVWLHYEPTNQKSYERLAKRWIQILRSMERDTRAIPLMFNIKNEVAARVSHHQCGTCRFGQDPATSVLDTNCCAHDVNNLYVVDSSFFPSSAAINPALTIMANALRVADHILGRFD